MIRTNQSGLRCEVTDLSMDFDKKRVLHSVSLTLEPGRTMALVGESGSGKSTLGKCIARLYEPTSGSIVIGDLDVTRLSRRDLRRHRRMVSLIFQDPAGSLNPRWSIGQIVSEPLQIHGVNRRDRENQVARMLEQVGLRRDVAERYPHEMSGGQRQRVSIARALISSPGLLIADEPTSALDVSVQAAILNLLVDLQNDHGFSCLFITHDLSAARFLADDISVLYLGKVVEQGSRAEVLDDPQDPYTRNLLSAAPIRDPRAQRARHAS